MFSIDEYLHFAVENKAADIFFQVGSPTHMKIGGAVQPVEEDIMEEEDMLEIFENIYRRAERDMSTFRSTGDDDFSFFVEDLARFRVNVYKAQGTYGSVIRVLTKQIPNFREQHIPDVIMDVANYKSGLILVSGVAGSGKSTTQACIINRINETRGGHIITLEDPIEYVHENKKCLITQRDVSIDSTSFAAALRAALRQAPDVILVGEMRDYETMSIALSAAETGHLVIATIHTAGAALSMDRIIDSFSADQQPQIRTQLGTALDVVISQKLVRGVDGNLYPAYEVMKATTSMKHFIRQGETHKLASALANSREPDMFSMEEYLIKMAKQGIISEDTVYEYSTNIDYVKTRLSGVGQYKDFVSRPGSRSMG